tara:strand:+ start:156 stop:512 length:357 start_codon:yes stop_codon:yes gene_type:complete
MATLSKEIQNVIDNTSDVLYREQIYINGKHDYDYHKLEAAQHATVHTLYYSDNDEWVDCIRKTVAMQLVDTGDGIQIVDVWTKKEINYLKAEQLHILLRLASVHSVYQIAEPTIRKDF